MPEAESRQRSGAARLRAESPRRPAPIAIAQEADQHRKPPGQSRQPVIAAWPERKRPDKVAPGNAMQRHILAQSVLVVSCWKRP